jgi:hypothetical protein
MSDLVAALIAESKRIEEDCEHSLKGHYNASSDQYLLHKWLGIPAAVCAAVASGTAFGSYEIIAGILAAISTILTAAVMFLKPLEKAEMHKSAAGQYHALRNRVRRFRKIELLDCSDVDSLKQDLLGFGERQDELNLGTLTIPRKAYEKAKSDIDAGMAQYQVDCDDSTNS